MKKFFTTLLVLTGVYSASLAQNKGQVAFGASVGVNSSYIVSNADYASSTSALIEPNFAFHAEYYIADHWSIKGEAIYDKKGWGNGIYADGSKQVINVNYNMNYLTIPVLATWHIGIEKLWYVNVGPYIGILMSASEDYDHKDYKSHFNSTDAGVNAGLGIQFPLSYKHDKTKFFVEYNWQFGSANVLADQSSGSATLMRQAVGAGIRF